MKEKRKLFCSLIICTIIFIIALYCYSSLFIEGEMIQKDVKIDILNPIYENSTYFFFCTVESTDSWEDYLRQDPDLKVYTPPANYTDAAEIRVENDNKWLIVYNHDIPHDDIVIRGEVVYKDTISRYSGIIKVNERHPYPGYSLLLIKNRDIIRSLTFLSILFWVSLLYISLSELGRTV